MLSPAQKNKILADVKEFATVKDAFDYIKDL